MMEKKKIIFFWTITILLPLIILCSFEVTLYLANYGDRPNLFIPAPLKFANQEYLKVNPEIAKRYFPKQGFVPRPARQYMLKNKPRNGYRIFVMGGSSAAGWPYPSNVMFSRGLKQRLSDTFPDKQIEIINTSLAAVNSFTLLDFMDEIVEHHPDAILIYAGHNEFYGALGAASTIALGKIRGIVKLNLFLQKFRTVQLLQDVISNVRGLFGKNPKNMYARNSTLMSQVVGKKNILLDSPTYKNGLQQFEGNLKDIFKKAQEANIPVLISELVSNLRDHRPFVSEASDKLLPAQKVYQQAQRLEAQNKISEARQLYYRAKDLDAMRFRASEDMNSIINQLADEFSIPVVPMKKYFEEASPKGLIGNNLMLEHLHPNADGQFLMSKAFYQTMFLKGFIRKNWKKEDQILPDSHYRNKWGPTELDLVLGKIKVLNLMDHWPFKPESESQNAIMKYQPQSLSENLALQIFFQKISFKNAHLKMAQFYLSKGNYEQAANEYRAIITVYPFDLDSYNRAAIMFLRAKQYQLAKLFLQNSLKVNDSGFAHKWISIIHLVNNNLPEGIKSLKKALYHLPDDPQILFNLSKAYINSKDFIKARATVARLEEIGTHTYDIDSLKQRLVQ